MSQKIDNNIMNFELISYDFFAMFDQKKKQQHKDDGAGDDSGDHNGEGATITKFVQIQGNQSRQRRGGGQGQRQ